VVVGGRDRNQTLKSAERYDPATDRWTDAGSLDVARWLHTAVLLPGGSILVTGGRGEANPLASEERYDSATNKWLAGGR
jgi:hypothetical protein